MRPNRRRPARSSISGLLVRAGGTITSYVGAVNVALRDILGKATRLSIPRLPGGRYVEWVTPYHSTLFTWPVDLMVRNPRVGSRPALPRLFKLGWGSFGGSTRGGTRSWWAQPGG